MELVDPHLHAMLSIEFQMNLSAETYGSPSHSRIPNGSAQTEWLLKVSKASLSPRNRGQGPHSSSNSKQSPDQPLRSASLNYEPKWTIAEFNKPDVDVVSLSACIFLTDGQPMPYVSQVANKLYPDEWWTNVQSTPIHLVRNAQGEVMRADGKEMPSRPISYTFDPETSKGYTEYCILL